MNYLSLRRSNSVSSANDAGVNPSLRSIYSNTNSGQRALVFSVQVPERGPLGLDLRARNVTSAQGQTGAIVKGFRPVKGGKRGFIELTGRVKEKDILTLMHTSKVDDMLFDAIVELAASLQSDLSAWPLRLEFRREPEEVEAKPKAQTFTSFLRSTSMSLAGFSTPAAGPTSGASTIAAPVVAAQDGTFQDKLNYFRGFFKDRLPTSTESKRPKIAIPPLPSEDLVNEMYRDLLVKRNVPDDVLDELVRIEQLDQKWQIVWSAKQNENDDNQVYIADAIKLAEALVELNWDNRGLQVLETLQRKIAAGTPEWTDQFIVSYGLDYLAMKMPEPSPYSIEHFYKNFERASRFCEVILKILLSLSHFASGIDAITQTLGLVDRLALCFHTDNADVKRMTLQVLGIICYNSAEGHAAVVHSFSNYMEVKGERVRFTCLRDALKSTRYNLLFKEDVLSFINILVNKGLRVESRVAIRQDFMTLGIGEYFEEIRTKSNNMYKQAAKVKKKHAPKTKPTKPTPKIATPSAPSLPVPPLALTRSSSSVPVHTLAHDDTTHGTHLDTIKEGTAVVAPVAQTTPSDAEPLIVLPDIPKPPGDAQVTPASPELLVVPAPSSVLPGTRADAPGTVQGAEAPASDFPRPSLTPLDVIQDDDEDDDDDVSSVDDEYIDQFDESPIQLQIREQLDNVEKQIEVFELFMADDRKDTLYGSTDLSSMESVIRSLMDRVAVDEFLRDCLLSMLQQLLFIPSETVLGKEMWAMAERVTKEIALLSPVEEVRQFELSFQDRKKLLHARDKFSAFLAEHEPADLHVMHIGLPITLMENRLNNPDDLLSDTDLDTESASEEDNQSEVEDDEISVRLEAFRKLRKMGMPVEQLQLKMQMENLDIAWLDKYTPKKAGKKAPTQVMVKDHDDYRKYCKLLSMGMPLPQVVMKMGAENPALDGNLLATPDKLIPLDGAEEEVAPVGVRADECPALTKFFKLKKMGMPPAQIQLKMQAEGFNQDLLLAPETLVDDDGHKVVVSTPVKEAAPPGVRADECPALTKFFKLKKMGMPQAQIELKMQAEGFDSDLLAAPDTIVDDEGKKVVIADQPPAGTRADECPALAKFFKLQKMGMPPPQIQLKMEAEGFDPALLLAPETLVGDDGKKVVAASAGVRADECPALAKFFKLKKMGMPAAQIQLKMQAEGFDAALMDAPDTIVDDDGHVPKKPVVMVKAKEHPSYAKFFKLMKMGMPLEQIKLKASSEGLDHAVLDTPDAMLPEDLSEPANKKPDPPKMVRVADHPSYAKYFKLAKMGMPPPQLQLKMKAEGLNPDLLDSPDKEIPEVADAPGPVLVKDHPDYAKYLKLQKMGMPAPQIELKMQAEGLDFALLATPDALVKPAEAAKADAKPSMGGALGALKFVSKIKAKPKLRNLYWEPVQAQVKETSLWANLDTANEQETAEAKHLQDLVTLFASAPPPTKEKTAKKPSTKKKAATRIGLIDVKRANNIGIMLARFRLPYAEIKRAILEVDRDILSSEKVAALIQFAPEGDELGTVKAYVFGSDLTALFDAWRRYTGDPKLLGDAEQYFTEIGGIPRFQTRLQSVLATMQFDSNVEEQRRLITSVVSTCKDLKNNDAIPQILKLVLQLGNALNEGTARGSASGFKLSILLKLVQVKAADNSMTLLNYLAKILRDKESDWLNFIDAIPSIQEASRVTHQVLKAGEAAIRKAADLVVQELDVHKKLPNVADNDKFQEAVGPFAEKAQEISQAIASEFEAMTADFNECVKWFGEDPDAAGMGPDSFFSIFLSFAQMLQAADRDNERKRIAEERRIRREAETKKRMDMLANSKQQKTGLEFNSLKAGDAQAIVKKIRGKRTEEKRKELVEQGFDHATNSDSFCSTSSLDKKKPKLGEAVPSTIAEGATQSVAAPERPTTECNPFANI